MHRALIVEDNATIRSAVAAFLKIHGLHVTECGTLHQAFECLRGESFALVVTDFHLPDGHGGMVIDAARIASPNTSCILMSGNTAAIPHSTTVAACKVLDKPDVFPGIEQLLVARGLKSSTHRAP
jgi:DNA-binding NtrC family response regulator